MLRKKIFKKVIKVSLVLFFLIGLVIVCSKFLIVLLCWILFGIIDVFRNRPINKMLLKQYFLSNGLLTFFLSPFNVLYDLMCYRNRKIYTQDDYPPAWKKEIEKVLQIFDENKQNIMTSLDSHMDNKKRGMIFYKWYNLNYNDSIVGFQQSFKYVKTIGVSVFNPHQSTSWHFGPLRLSFRILYNLLPENSDKAYIMTMGKTHYWKDNPFFSFDDTLFHRSVNETDKLRYCAFIDVIRPSPIPNVLNVFVIALGAIMQKVRGIFYKHWDLLG